MEAFYATNNQFQKAGPKGFVEVKVLENDKVYVRVDLPGVPDDAVRLRVDAVRQKVVFFSDETVHDMDGVREYSGTAVLGCDCCEITGLEDVKMKDGVLRMILSRSRVKVNKDQQNHNNNDKCTLTVPPFTGQSGIRLEDHPYIVKGRKGVLFGTAIVGTGLYYAADLPSVYKDDVQVDVYENGIRFKAEIKDAYEHDGSGRTYVGLIISPPSRFLPVVSSHTISWDVEFGVLKIVVIPPGNNNNNNNAG
ncbi:PREDICTED: uncharacterized protein LOC104763001 [Camelina sativa]|uniref:Uncharacterized protein LOC104763001 n=1 Tax=Camelina sativa TaxID=90675 RepID=A0ABM0XEI1_CAMSA|nr:PREDICTED: uncharacterized protein LOC104763001 [Camelina sativa]